MKDKSDKSKNSVSELKQTLQQLRSMLRSKTKKLKNANAEIKQLKRALNESAVYIDDKLADIPVEDIVRYFKNKKKGKLEEVEKAYEASKEYLRDKWQCYKCDTGFLRLMIINRIDGKHYFRSCNECDNRTKIKVYHDDVQE